MKIKVKLSFFLLIKSTAKTVNFFANMKLAENIKTENLKQEKVFLHYFLFSFFQNIPLFVIGLIPWLIFHNCASYCWPNLEVFYFIQQFSTNKKFTHVKWTNKAMQWFSYFGSAEHENWEKILNASKRYQGYAETPFKECQSAFLKISTRKISFHTLKLPRNLQMFGRNST